MRTKLLNSNDYEAFATLMLSQKSYFGLPIEQFPGDVQSDKALLYYFNQYLRSENPYFKCFGAFDEDSGQLIGSISADFMQAQPTWILRRIVVSETIKTTEIGKNVMHSLMSAVLEVAEAAKYYQHIYLIPAKYKKAHAKIWGEVDIRKDRYTAYELELVPANTPSRFRDHWEYLYGRILFPLDTSVRMSVLHNELRRA